MMIVFFTLIVRIKIIDINGKILILDLIHQVKEHLICFIKLKYL